jgi:hypothetical protein
MEGMNFYPDNIEPGRRTPDSEGSPETVFGDGYQAPDAVPTDDRIPSEYDVLSVGFLIEPTVDTRRTFSELTAAVREQGEVTVNHNRSAGAVLGDRDNDPDHATIMCNIIGVSDPHKIETQCIIDVAVWHRAVDGMDPQIKGYGFMSGEAFGQLSHEDYLAALDRLASKIDGAEYGWLQEVLQFSQLAHNNPHRTMAANLVIDAAPSSIPVYEVTSYSLSKVTYNNGAIIAHDWEESNESFKISAAKDSSSDVERLLIRLPAGDTIHYTVGRNMSECLFVTTQGDTPQGDVPAGLPTFGPHERSKQIHELREAGVLSPTDASMAALIAQVRAALDSGIQQPE